MLNIENIFPMSTTFVCIH